MANAPVETKVKAATASAAVAGVIVWALTAYVFPAGTPGPILILVDVAVPAVWAFTAGWWADHTPRPAGPPPP